MATLADLFPTPCSASFWTPDCDLGELGLHSSDAPTTPYCRVENAYPRQQHQQQKTQQRQQRTTGQQSIRCRFAATAPSMERKYFSAPCGEGNGLSHPCNRSAESWEPVEEELIRPVPCSSTTQRHYRAVAEGLILAQEPGNSATASVQTTETPPVPQVHRIPDKSETDRTTTWKLDPFHRPEMPLPASALLGAARPRVLHPEKRVVSKRSRRPPAALITNGNERGVGRRGGERHVESTDYSSHTLGIQGGCEVGRTVAASGTKRSLIDKRPGDEAGQIGYGQSARGAEAYANPATIRDVSEILRCILPYTPRAVPQCSGRTCKYVMFASKT